MLPSFFMLRKRIPGMAEFQGNVIHLKIG
jgi:hypothetical protein